MTDDTSRVPKLRFPGFTGAWEQRKLSELATMHARIGWQNLRTSEFLDSGDYMLITGTDFEDGAINYSTCHYVEKMRYDQDTHIQIDNGSILITKDGTLGKVAYVQGLSMPATLNAGVFNVEIKDEKEVDRKYLFQYLKAPFLMDYVDKKATGGTIKHLNQNILVDFPVVLPNIEEQTSIGAYFSSLDNLITLHQRKLSHLRELKRGLLQKMFPKSGEDRPEVRFPGFADAWEQRKLGSVIEERNIQQAQSRKYPLVSFTVEQGVTPKTKRYEREQLVVGDKASKKYKITEYNDIVYNPANLKFGAISRNTYGNAVFSPIYVTFVVDLEVASPSFIGLFVTRQDFIQRSLMYQQGTVYERQSVNPEDLLSMNCYLPSRPEQESISLLFGQLDDLITLHQRKLSHLQQQKKALLQQMFV